MVYSISRTAGSLSSVMPQTLQHPTDLGKWHFTVALDCARGFNGCKWDNYVFSRWVPLWRKEYKAIILIHVSQGLTDTPERGAIPLETSHRFLVFMVEEAQLLQLSGPTAPLTTILFPQWGCTPMTRTVSRVPLILRSPLISLKLTCPPNGFFLPRKDWQWKSAFLLQSWLVSWETFFHDFSNKKKAI